MWSSQCLKPLIAEHGLKEHRQMFLTSRDTKTAGTLSEQTSILQCHTCKLRVSSFFGNTVKSNRDFQTALILQWWTVYKHCKDITDHLSIHKESCTAQHTDKVFGGHYYLFCVLIKMEFQRSGSCSSGVTSLQKTSFWNPCLSLNWNTCTHSSYRDLVALKGYTKPLSASLHHDSSISTIGNISAGMLQLIRLIWT